MSRIAQDKQTVKKMIALYCRRRLKAGTVPEEYRRLADYACRRLDHCRYGEHKTDCKNCPTHCYAPSEREAIREVMRWAGPRMMLYYPADTIVYLLRKMRCRLSTWSHKCKLSMAHGRWAHEPRPTVARPPAVGSGHRSLLAPGKARRAAAKRVSRPCVCPPIAFLATP